MKKLIKINYRVFTYGTDHLEVEDIKSASPSNAYVDIQDIKSIFEMKEDNKSIPYYIVSLADEIDFVIDKKSYSKLMKTLVKNEIILL